MSDNFSKKEVEFLNSIEEEHFWYRSRQKLIDLLLKSFTDRKSPRPKILDLGCGNGSMVKPIQKWGQYFGLDCESDFARNCALKNVPVFIGDACALPFENEYFDVVTILDLLEHVDNDKKVLDECYRVLKLGGKLIVFIPAFNLLWTSFDFYSYHKRRYEKADILKILEQKGFKIIKKSYYFSFLFPVLLFFAAIEKFGLRGHSNNRKKTWEIRLKPPNRLVNNILAFFGEMEAFFLIRCYVPIGSTLVLIAKK